jgi:soluble lytic murein transglycosylase-like protein
VITISGLLAAFAWNNIAFAGQERSAEFAVSVPSIIPVTETASPAETTPTMMNIEASPTGEMYHFVAPTSPLLMEPSPTAAVAEARIVSLDELQVDAQVGISTVAAPVWSGNVTSISPVFTKEVQHWGPDIVRWSAVAGVDPNLAATVMQIESCGDPRATSTAGAMGLFQVMPFHFRTGENGYSPETNALRGLNYLSRSLAAGSGDARLALAGYNGGIGVIERGEWTWSAQTQRYVQYGWPIYHDASSGAATSASVQEWYSSYGASLCRQASERLGLE